MFAQIKIFSVIHECVNIVVLLPFLHLPLPLPLAIFSAQLAHFRQRKTKSENTQSQKKAAKRKGSSIHTHDIPKEECTLVAQVSDFLSDLGMSMESQTEDPDVSEASFEAKVNLLKSPCIQFKPVCN